MDTTLPARLQRYIEDNALTTKRTKILVAVSGGVDSMVLLSLLVRGGYDIGVAHCNFQLRGQESDADEDLVEKQASEYGVPIHKVRFDTQAQMERTGESVQIAARRLRYEWFDELCKEYGYGAVAIAHHLDDAIETFFINLLRGTGLQGLTGIRRINGLIIRPLLFASREEIANYASENNIAFREDSSNRSPNYLRNKLRLGVIPHLKEINPNFTQAMEHNLNRLSDARLLVNHAVERIRDEVEIKGNGLITLDLSKIDPKLPLGFVIYELLIPYGFNGDVAEDILKALEDGVSGKRFYSNEYIAYTDRGRIILEQQDQQIQSDATIEIDADMRKMEYLNSVIYIDKIGVQQLDILSQPSNVALLDMDRLEFPLKVRLWSDGDSFVPLGMGGSKKVSDFLIDNKVPLVEKNRQLVVVSRNIIVWVVGRRIDDRYKITPQTKNILKLIKK